MRGRKAREASGGLFPFLSILSGLIGVMILLICVAVLGEVAPSQSDDALAKERLDEQLARLQALEAEAPDVSDDVADRIRREVERLRLQLEQLPDTPDDVKEKIKLVSFGTGAALRPSFIECHADGLLIHSSGARVPADSIKDSAVFSDELKAVQAGRRAVVFLVRDDGVKTYQQAVEIARAVCDRVGAAPILRDAAIDWSQFDEGNP